ncbi:hypothetical protein H1Z61_04060 [Bacillus aquiflavi]|uniref:Uncharacterized protein n=1 Tax=Bacillus aquiflavi TaxID=2672567 RepID=A0A6B3VZC8_9BACI|nr:hypothetical protein [Bacillus aquiflavi]MBA4536336.1 hypothetical protein [Bacillus aquiflavi]NEY80704.1 hypothetical protein [Bacillus aquiflavi]
MRCLNSGLHCIIQNKDQLIEQLSLLTPEKIVSIFGTGYDEVSSMMGNEKMWRYDLCVNNEYEYNDEYDVVDLEALKNNQVQYIVFFTFTNDGHSLSRISLYYKDESGNIHEYTIFPDGTSEDSVIEHLI